MAQAPTIRPYPGITPDLPFPGIAAPTRLRVTPGLQTLALLLPPGDTEDDGSFAIRSVDATSVTAHSFIVGSGLKFNLYAGAGPTYPTGQKRAISYDSMTKVFGGQFS